MSASGPVGFITDLHSHLVPAVDDGATSIEDAMEGLGRMFEGGIGTVITTPHLEGSLTRDHDGLAIRLAEVDRAFERLCDAARTAYPEVSLGLGHEIRLDRPDPDLADPRLRLGGSDAVLVEWPRLLIPPETPSVLRGLRAQGVRPIIAHPERYRGYDSGGTLVVRWRQEGALLQVNLGSLVDRYGPAARVAAFEFLEQGWADCLASDFHGRPHLRLYLDEVRSVFADLQAADSWDLLTSTNPARILRGEDPLPVPPVVRTPGFLERIRTLLGG